MVRLAFGPDEAAAERLAADLVPAIRAREGCLAAVFFGPTEDGDYGLFVHWDTLEHADAAASVIGPRLQKAVQGKVQEPPDIAMFQVVGPEAVAAR